MSASLALFRPSSSGFVLVPLVVPFDGGSSGNCIGAQPPHLFLSVLCAHERSSSSNSARGVPNEVGIRLMKGATVVSDIVQKTTNKNGRVPLLSVSCGVFFAPFLISSSSFSLPAQRDQLCVASPAAVAGRGRLFAGGVRCGVPEHHLCRVRAVQHRGCVRGALWLNHGACDLPSSFE